MIVMILTVMRQLSVKCESIVSENFDGCHFGGDYTDDIFYNTNNPQYAKGECTISGGYLNSGGLHLVLGDVDRKGILNGMSGGWVHGYSFGAEGTFVITLKYRMVMNRFDADECAKALVQFDNDNVIVLEQLCGRGKDTGWKTKTFTVSLSPGVHKMNIGGYCNKKTGPLEAAHIYFDDIEIR